jgi:transposase
MSTAKTDVLQALPDDVEILKKIIAGQHQALAEKDASLTEKDHIIAILEEYVRLQKLKKFGASTEKSHDQQEMFNEAELSVEAEQILVEQEDRQAKKGDSTPARRKSGRKPLPAGLPRLLVEHDLPDAEKRCACGTELSEIGNDSSEQLDIIPAKIQVLVHVRKKYACRQCEEGVKTAALPPQPLPKSNASSGLLAHVAIAKYQDGLPLYRQEAILNRSGIEIPRNTLSNWMIKTGQLVQPLLNLLEDKLLAYPVLHCDETTVQVLKEPGKKASSNSYMWVRVGGPPTQPIRLFHYADSRRGEVVSHLLAGYSGYLQTDDYAGYNAVATEDSITQLGCWAHVRRKFIEAQKATLNSKKSKTSKADIAVSLIGKLYAIEKESKDLSLEERYSIRQQSSVPLLKEIRAWLDQTLHNTLPKGLLGKALSYMDKNWNKLTVYINDGRLCIDNNPAENAIRPFVIGRKNWLFSATVPGAKASANLYSLIETAKANGQEPYAYLRHIIKELPKATTVDAIEALLPWNLSAKTLVAND